MKPIPQTTFLDVNYYLNEMLVAEIAQMQIKNEALEYGESAEAREE